MFVASSLFTACNESEATSSTFRILEMKREPLYRIQADASLSGIAEYYQPVGSHFVYFLSTETSSIHRLNVTNGTLKRLTIIRNMPVFDGYSVDERAKKITLYSEDSVSFFDFNGKFHHSYSLQDKTNDGYFTAINRLFLPIEKNGKRYVHYFAKEKKSYKNPAFFKKPLEAEWDLKTGRVRLIPQVYPANFQQYCYSYNYLADRIEIEPTIHGYTFPYNDSIFFCNIITGERSAAFFGSRGTKKFKHIPYNEISTLHESVFDQLVMENPYYMLSRNFPQSGYYTRMLLFQPTDEQSEVQQHLIIFDRDFKYIGETKPPFSPNILVDTKGGLVSMEYSLKDHVLILEKLSW